MIATIYVWKSTDQNVPDGEEWSVTSSGEG
jgi:hypothetical protein